LKGKGRQEGKQEKGLGSKEMVAAGWFGEVNHDREGGGGGDSVRVGVVEVTAGHSSQ